MGAPYAKAAAATAPSPSLHSTQPHCTATGWCRLAPYSSVYKCNSKYTYRWRWTVKNTTVVYSMEFSLLHFCLALHFIPFTLKWNRQSGGISVISPSSRYFKAEVKEQTSGNETIASHSLVSRCLPPSLSLPNKRAMALYTCVDKGNKSATGFWQPLRPLQPLNSLGDHIWPQI